MNTLPKWVLANPFPAIHDFESLTVLDQTARIYGAMNELIEKYNEMVQQISNFEKSETESREDFETKLTKVIREFMCSWEQKTQDLNVLAQTVINEAIQAGAITVTQSYDPDTESLNIVVGGEV